MSHWPGLLLATGTEDYFDDAVEAWNNKRFRLALFGARPHEMYDDAGPPRRPCWEPPGTAKLGGARR